MEIQNQSMGNPPDNNLVWAILCTVMCCMPLGIVAIIKSTKVKRFGHKETKQLLTKQLQTLKNMLFGVQFLLL